METMPAVRAEMGDAASQVFQNCLGTPVILRQLLEHFSNNELIELSLVNKQWNYEARCVLRDRGNVVARIWRGDTCKSLVAFASDLEKMQVVPFSGIELLLRHINARLSLCTGSLDPSYKVILQRLPWKHFHVRFSVNWINYRDCPAMALVKRILDDFSGVIQNLSLTNLGEAEVEWVRKRLKNWSFSRVTTLELSVNIVARQADFVKALVACAPNLQELHIYGEVLEENVLEGSYAVLVPGSDFNPLYQRYCESLIGVLRPKTMEVYVVGTGDFDKELLKEFIPRVLQACRTSLTTLGMDLLFALPLMCYGICLENVTTLDIRAGGLLMESLPQPIMALLKRFDFTRVFPKLTQVQILRDTPKTDDFSVVTKYPLLSCFFPDDIHSFVEQGSAVLKNTLPDRAININKLTFKESTWESSVRFWAQMFPHVSTLSVETNGTTESPFADLLNNFVNLEELNVTLDQRGRSMIVNLDSVFCGIFPEEVTELRGKNDQYLKAVHIVPVKPSITCMRGLRSLNCRYTSRCDWGMRNDCTLMFSKVAALIGFARCPSLAVTLECYSYDAEGLRHLEPYVTFVVKD